MGTRVIFEEDPANGRPHVVWNKIASAIYSVELGSIYCRKITKIMNSQSEHRSLLCLSRAGAGVDTNLCDYFSALCMYSIPRYACGQTNKGMQLQYPYPSPFWTRVTK